MYTQNGNPDRNVEALVIRVVWPDWLAELEQTYDNPMFLPINFVDFTAGYDTNSAVLFPETVAVREVPTFHWGAIFCDREAARFRRVSTAAARDAEVALPPDAAAAGRRTRAWPRARSCCGTSSTTARTATATCRSTRS